MDEATARTLMAKVLQGLKYIHENGFCHLDLKLDNILVDNMGNPKIADFGLASDKEFFTVPNRTPGY